MPVADAKIKYVCSPISIFSYPICPSSDTYLCKYSLCKQELLQALKLFASPTQRGLTGSIADSFFVSFFPLFHFFSFFLFGCVFFLQRGQGNLLKKTRNATAQGTNMKFLDCKLLAVNCSHHIQLLSSYQTVENDGRSSNTSAKTLILFQPAFLGPFRQLPLLNFILFFINLNFKAVDIIPFLYSSAYLTKPEYVPPKLGQAH